ncbi:MAG: AbrB/MazE/SpoVT family DNA-binding domain-containing protein [Candidatus Kapabacteria bacterium]|nr:AbrB/MazE/SpoVT family DNA-binding domain-containing protein [Candidatus Kapabacteria bacterium]
MRIAKWGNSLAVRLPLQLVEELNLKEGDQIDLIKGDSDTFLVHRYDDPAELLRRIRRFRGRMPAGYRFDRDSAHER